MSLTGGGPRPSFLWSFDSSNVDAVTGLTPYDPTFAANSFPNTYVPGLYKNAVILNNIPGQATSPSINAAIFWSTSFYNLALAKNWAITCWICPISFNDSPQVFLYFANRTSGNPNVSICYYLIYGSNSGNFIFMPKPNTTVAPSASTTNISIPMVQLNTWMHLAISMNNETMYIYKDGVLLGSSVQTGAFIYTGTQATSNTLNYIEIGGQYSGGLPANIKFQDLRIHNTGLNIDQVQFIYAQQGVPPNAFTNMTMINPTPATQPTNGIQFTGTPILSQLSVAPVGAFSLRAVKGVTAKAVNVVRYPVVQWPPVSMTSNATVVSGQVYGNGTYVANASVSYNSTWNIFDNNINTYYENTATFPYNPSTGTYIGSTPETTISTVSVSGEWFQLELPTSIILRSYTLVGRQDDGWWGNRNPTTFWIAGSNNLGGPWSNVHQQTNITPPQEGITINVPTTSNSLPYTYYRLVVNVIGNSNTIFGQRNIVNLASWNLYGDSPSYTTGSSDFYADRLGNLLTAPVTGTDLASWLGGATGYVATWYNQLNPLNNVSQSDAMSQPTISGGAITFTGTQWFSNTATTGGLLANGQQKYSYAACFNSSTAGVYTVCDTNSSGVTGSAAGRIILILNYVGFNGENNDKHNMTPFTNGVQKSVVMMIDNTQVNNITTVSAGVNVNNATNNPTGLNLSNYQFGIGRKMSTGTEYFIGTMKSVMVFNTALSAVDAAILDTWQGTL